MTSSSVTARVQLSCHSAHSSAAVSAGPVCRALATWTEILLAGRSAEDNLHFTLELEVKACRAETGPGVGRRETTEAWWGLAYTGRGGKASLTCNRIKKPVLSVGFINRIR